MTSRIFCVFLLVFLTNEIVADEASEGLSPVGLGIDVVPFLQLNPNIALQVPIGFDKKWILGGQLQVIANIPTQFRYPLSGTDKIPFQWLDLVGDVNKMTWPCTGIAVRVDLTHFVFAPKEGFFLSTGAIGTYIKPKSQGPADVDSIFLAGLGGLGYQWQMGNWFISPGITLDVRYRLFYQIVPDAPVDLWTWGVKSRLLLGYYWE